MTFSFGFGSLVELSNVVNAPQILISQSFFFLTDIITTNAIKFTLRQHNV